MTVALPVPGRCWTLHPTFLRVTPRAVALFVSPLVAYVPSTFGQDGTARLPAEQWMRYADLEDAGWSPEGVHNALAFADSLGSAAVMLVDGGVVVAASGDVATHENV